MSVFSEFHFLRPLWLLLIPVIMGLWWSLRRRRNPLQGWKSVMDPQLLAALTVGSTRQIDQRLTLLGIAWLVAIIGVAGPTWRPEPSPFADDPVPVMVVLTAGETMDSTDLIPSRMERARLKVVDYANARKGQPMGLIAYAGSAHLVLPPTRDTSVVATMAGEIRPEIMPQPGDDLTSALRLAEQTLGDGGGLAVVVVDAIGAESLASLQEFAVASSLPVNFLAVARSGTPEFEGISAAASTVAANVTLLSPDSRDIDELVRATAHAPIAVAATDDGVRWSEAGWWLVPVLVVMSLAGFRREEDASIKEVQA